MRINVAIAIAEEVRDCIYEVAQVCRALGFAHNSTLPDIGVLIGSAEVEDLPMLRAIPGVLAVEIERSLRIAASDTQPAAAGGPSVVVELEREGERGRGRPVCCLDA